MGKLIPPKLWPSDGGLGLTVSLDQSKYTANLKNPVERERNDLWWLDDENNVKQVVEDLAQQVMQKVPEYLINDLELTYKDRRDFFPPDDRRLQEYIMNASKDGAISWLKKMIKFSNYLHQEKDERIYSELLKSIS